MMSLMNRQSSPTMANYSFFSQHTKTDIYQGEGIGFSAHLHLCLGTCPGCLFMTKMMNSLNTSAVIIKNSFNKEGCVMKTCHLSL